MRARGFLVVLHDVHKGIQTKVDVIDHVMAKKPVQAVVAEEPYGHQEGSHIHVFYRLENQSEFKAQLKYWVMFWKSGRSQVDVMRGEMSQACRYLVQESTRKTKDCDPSPFMYPSKEIIESASEYADRWLDDWLKPEWGKNYPSAAFQTAWKKSMDESKIKILE